MEYRGIFLRHFSIFQKVLFHMKIADAKQQTYFYFNVWLWLGRGAGAQIKTTG